MCCRCKRKAALLGCEIDEKYVKLLAQRCGKHLRAYGVMDY